MRQAYPDMPFLYSFDHGDVKKYEEVDCSFLDLYEHHIWMAQQNGGEFYKLVGYGYNRFSPDDYKNGEKRERVYRERPEYWQKLLTDKIESLWLPWPGRIAVLSLRQNVGDWWIIRIGLY